MATKIKKCEGANCKSEFQDQTYGKGQRVHNENIKKPTGYRCTVCGNKS